MIFSFIPYVSPTVPFASIVPVAFIFGVNMIREGGEDILRFLNDRKENKSPTQVYSSNGFKTIDTRDIHVGDIVKVFDNDSFPADCILISSSEEDGSCKIETANLDGETSLKARYCPNGFSFLKSEVELGILSGFVECQTPNEKLYKFEGFIKIDGKPEASLSHMNLLLKGSKLKSTSFIYGLVIYTGPDTKIMRNMQRGSKVKFSIVNVKLNYFIACLFLLQVALCVILVALSAHYEFKLPTLTMFSGKRTPVGISDTGFVVVSILTYFLLLNLLIPVSLFVSLEFVKLIQAWFITMDNNMAIYETDPHNPESKIFIHAASITSNLNADLSQIGMLF